MAPKAEAEASAALKVLGTYELLEHILGCVGFADLISAKCVIRSWRDVINRSLTLQRTLFLAPAPGSKMLLWEKFRHENRPKVIDWTEEFDKTWTYPIIKLHPLLIPDYTMDMAWTDFVADAEGLYLRPPPPDMLFSQPPVTKISIRWLAERRTEYEDASGIKFGAITSWLHAALEKSYEQNVESLRFQKGTSHINVLDDEIKSRRKVGFEKYVKSVLGMKVHFRVERCLADTCPWVPKQKAGETCDGVVGMTSFTMNACGGSTATSSRLMRTYAQGAPFGVQNCWAEGPWMELVYTIRMEGMDPWPSVWRPWQ